MSRENNLFELRLSPVFPHNRGQAFQTRFQSAECRRFGTLAPKQDRRWPHGTSKDNFSVVCKERFRFVARSLSPNRFEKGFDKHAHLHRSVASAL